MDEEEHIARMRLASGIRMALSLMRETTKAGRAARLGVSTTTLDRWAAGASTPTPGNIDRLSLHGQMTVDEIWAGRFPVKTTSA